MRISFKGFFSDLNITSKQIENNYDYLEDECSDFNFAERFEEQLEYTDFQERFGEIDYDSFNEKLSDMVYNCRNINSFHTELLHDIVLSLLKGDKTIDDLKEIFDIEGSEKYKGHLIGLK